RGARALLESKHRDVSYGGELGRLREIQCRHWVHGRSGSFMDYQYTLADYANPPGLAKPKPWLNSGQESLKSAVRELERRGGFEGAFVIITRKR
ncbi:MAG: hypothetical protein LPK09_01990, partial [Hymenobacteraceae bacterium]|nr:hypothetical protein [Hymenobacteraceae bacterium]